MRIRLRLFQLSLWALFVVLTMLTICCGWFAWQKSQVEQSRGLPQDKGGEAGWFDWQEDVKQRAEVIRWLSGCASISSLDGSGIYASPCWPTFRVYFDDDQLPWYRKLLHDHYVAEVEYVGLDGVSPRPELKRISVAFPEANIYLAPHRHGTLDPFTFDFSDPEHNVLSAKPSASDTPLKTVTWIRQLLGDSSLTKLILNGSIQRSRVEETIAIFPVCLWLGWQKYIVHERQAMLDRIRELGGETPPLRWIGFQNISSLKPDRYGSSPKTVSWIRELLGDSPLPRIYLRGSITQSQIEEIIAIFPETDLWIWPPQEPSNLFK